VKWFGALINRYLLLDPEIAEQMKHFAGKVIAVEILGINKTLYLLPQSDLENDLIKITEECDDEPDTILSGAPAALFKMGLSSDVAPMMLRGEVEISGDVRLGREFKKLLAEIEVDWEEHLATFIGDAPARHLANATKGFTRWASKARRAISADISEYLQEESRDVVAGAELEIFYQDVDELRNAVDRLGARFDTLTKEVRS